MKTVKISLVDVFAKMSEIQGSVSEITKLVPVVSAMEKDIIRLQESQKGCTDRHDRVEIAQKSLVQEFKDSRKTDQYILVAIGVAAIGAQILIPIIISKF